MATARPTGNLVDTIARHTRDIRKLRAKLAGDDGVSDHGALTGLGDDDHTQYHTDARAATWLATQDHGVLSGLGDDDHTQYLLADGSRAMSGALRVPDGSANDPSYTFDDDQDTGLYLISGNRLGIAAGGAKAMEIRTSVIDFFPTDGSTLKMRMGNSLAIVTPLTTGSAANLNVGASGLSDIRRATSALRYKSDVTDADYLADLKLRPTKHWRVDDEAYRYGLVADELVAQDEMLGVYDENGEVENYDTRAVITVLAAKINRLETQILKLL